MRKMRSAPRALRTHPNESIMPPVPIGLSMVATDVLIPGAGNVMVPSTVRPQPGAELPSALASAALSERASPVAPSALPSAGGIEASMLASMPASTVASGAASGGGVWLIHRVRSCIGSTHRVCSDVWLIHRVRCRHVWACIGLGEDGGATGRDSDHCRECEPAANGHLRHLRFPLKSIEERNGEQRACEAVLR